MMMSSMGHFFMPVNQNNMDFKNTYLQSYRISIEKFNFQGLYLVCNNYLLVASRSRRLYILFSSSFFFLSFFFL